MKKVIVISGANLFSGGTLSIFKDCLQYANEYLIDYYDVIALVNDPNDFVDCKKIKFLNFHKIRKSYFHRLYYEYWHYSNLSFKLQPYLWLSMNDMSSNIQASRRAVYCHNPTPFKQIKISDIWNQTQVFFFTLFYKYLYSINITKNNYVIVQQNWLRFEFAKMFGLTLSRIIVAPPKVIPNKVTKKVKDKGLNKATTFCFPTFPRPFKNIEVIGEAVRILNQKGILNFIVKITVDGSENQYSRSIVKKYQRLNPIRFIGQITREEVYELYKDADCLIFPSTLETWGLPITEFKFFHKPILLANLEYAHETLGDYSKGAFFDPQNPEELAHLMMGVINNDLKCNIHNSVLLNPPVAHNWSELFYILLEP